MKKQLYYIILIALGFHLSASAQMEIDGQTLFGNEWINFDQEYFKIVVDQDRVYKVTGSELTASGVNLSSFQGSELQLFVLGKEVPIQVSTDGVFGDNDYIVFEGKRNDGKLDEQLYFRDGEIVADSLQLNPKYSLFSDKSSYFLTWSPGDHKRINEVVNEINDVPSPESFYVHEESIIYNDFLFKRTYNGSDKVRLSDFDLCEGFGSYLIPVQNVRLKTSNRIQNPEINPTFSMRYGANGTQHHFELKVGDEILFEDLFNDYNVKDLSIELDEELLKNNTAFKISGKLSSDSYTVAHATLTYARELVFPDTLQYNFFSRDGAENRYYEIDNFTTVNDPLFYYDFENQSYKIIELENDKRKFKVDNNESKRKVCLVSEQGYTPVLGISQQTFIDYTKIDPEFAIITSKVLHEEEYNGENMIDAYANYRSSEKGGGYRVNVVHSEDLVDQFAYGIERNPLSGKNFINFIKSHWLNQKFLFTIGKGVEYSVNRTEEDLMSDQIPYSHVPTWGVPGSDNLLYGKKGQTSPLVPLGRLSARDAKDIRIYLDKVLAHESILDGEYTPEEIQWTKKIIHLSGGDAVIQNQIFNWLEDMKRIIEGDMYGAEVTTFRKTSTDNLQSADSEMILNAINNGVSIITFFGHSAVGTFDFSLEAASEYDNKDKYPLLISLGCHSGNIFAGSTKLGLSEEFVLEEEAGSLAFLASTSTAYISPQFVTGRTFYQNVSEDFYGQPIGNALKAYFDGNANNNTLSVRSLNQQMTYHGDPAISFVNYDLPDYLVDKNSIGVTPKIITTSDKNYELTFDVINSGRSIRDSIEVKVTHYVPDSTTKEYTKRISTPSFKESINFTIDNPGLNALGKNLIDIHVDFLNEVDEGPLPTAEENNKLSVNLGTPGFEYFVESNIAIPVSPSEFSIVTKNKVSLIAATTNLFSDNRGYILQIDTSELFLNPLDEITLEKDGGKIEWAPNVTLENELVYYWRISPSESNEGFIWRNSSFVALLDESEGWNQSHFYQFRKDAFDDIRLPVHDSLIFGEDGFFVSVKNKIYDPNNNACYQFDFENCASSVSPWNFMNNGGLAIAVGDEVSGNLWINNGGDYGSVSTNQFSSFRVFGFETQTAEDRAKIIDFLENVIPDGAYVLAWTALKYDYNDIKVEEWRGDTLALGTSIFKVFESEGAGLTETLEQNGTVPYNFLYQKGRKVFGEHVGSNIYEEVVTTMFFPILETQGKISSTIIGPSVSWGHLEWEVDTPSENDSFRLLIIGINEVGKETIIDTLENQFSFDLSEISASQFKFLRLEYEAFDEVDRTPAILDFWRVYYDEYPEAIFNPEVQYVFNSDTLEQGEFLNFSVNVENITSTPMDELLVHYIIIDEENNEIFVSIKDEKINANGSINISFDYPTAQFLGEYLFIVEFNPEFEQKEKFIFNNLGFKPFYVQGSKLNPLLDVTFDNKRINNGAIISPTPVIDIRIYDENKFLLNTDPLSFQQAILREDGTRIDFEYPSDLLTYFPGTIDNSNTATMRLMPEKLEAGNYTFLAQAKNASGVFSADNNYSVDFRILSNSCISNFHNYPNPVFDFANIEYTLSGTVQPESMSLDIFDSSGKVIKVIESNDLFNTGIGENQLLFQWDGTNHSNAEVSKGLYFYRLRINGLPNNKSFRNCGELDSQLFGKLIKLN